MEWNGDGKINRGGKELREKGDIRHKNERGKVLRI